MPLSCNPLINPDRPSSVRDGADHARMIVERLGGRWHGVHGVCRCPAHPDKTPSLSVRLGDRAILFHCFAGCTSRAILAALKSHRLNDDVKLAMPANRPLRDFGGLARRLWQASRPLTGTLAEAYLRARGLSEPFSPALRFNAATILGSGAQKRIMPALIAAVENDFGVVAVQRTFLDPDDVLRKPLAKAKVSLGPLGRAAIRLAPATVELGLAEGVEDAQSAMEWFGTPTWALGGVERLALVDIPEKVRRVVVYADRGFAAERLLEKARTHLTGNGRELVSRVPERHADWNDAWRAYRQGRDRQDAGTTLSCQAEQIMREEREPSAC